jgi:glycosyltransferase involved in cell wall biosynthesis
MKGHVLVLVENLSVPFDRRVWQESSALAAAGYAVTVVCPQGRRMDTERETVLEGVRILRYPLRPATGGPLGYLREYALALAWTSRIALQVRRQRHVDVVHACNPPDLFFVVALLLRPRGTQFVFDHHDLVPELFRSRFAGGPRLLHWVSRLLERLTFASADYVVATNDSYRDIAVRRGHVPAERVVVVRSGPDTARFVPRAPDPGLRRGRRFLLAYLGVMGPQDGVDYALRALAELVQRHRRTDFHCIFMGDGDVRPQMQDLAVELGLADLVEFTGRVPDEYVQRCLSTADVCLSPDPSSPLNDVSTMNKVVEYMAMGRPQVAFDLKETRVSAGDAALYAPPNDEAAFADHIDRLLDDPELRTAMGRHGQRRVHEELSWDRSRERLVELYDTVLGLRPAQEVSR